MSTLFIPRSRGREIRAVRTVVPSKPAKIGPIQRFDISASPSSVCVDPARRCPRLCHAALLFQGEVQRPSQHADRSLAEIRAKVEGALKELMAT